MHKYTRYKCNVVRNCAAAIAALVLFLFSSTAMCDTQQGEAVSELDAAGVTLLKTFEKAVVAETVRVDKLREELKNFELVQKAISTEIYTYEMQNAAHGNLLLLPNTALREIEKALGENRAIVDAIGGKIKVFTKQQADTAKRLLQTDEQIALERKQQGEIGMDSWEKAEKTALLVTLDRLLAILAEKQKTLKMMNEGETFIVNQLEAVNVAAAALSKKLTAQIQSRAKQQLFKRDFQLVKAIKWQNIASEVENAARTLVRFFGVEFWTTEGARITGAGARPLVTLLILILIGTVIPLKLRKVCMKYENRLSVDIHRWRGLCLMLVRRSLLLIGAALVFYGYDQIQFPHYKVPFIRLILNLLLVVVMSRWGLDFLKHRPPGDTHPAVGATLFRVRLLVVYLRLLAIGYLLSLWAMGPESLILFALRLALEIGLIAWCYGYWKAFLRAKQTAAAEPAMEPTAWQTMGKGFCYFLSVGGLLIELAGYPALTVYWFVSWGKTIAIVFWAIVLFRAIREWQQQYRISRQTQFHGHFEASEPLHLLLVQAAWILWTLAFLCGLILAWSTNRAVFEAVYGFLSSPWTIGSINLSVSGLIWSFLVLFFTYTLTRLSRYLLAEKILTDVTWEPGLKASIITITLYLIWGLGLILALSVMGVSTTSLAVVFGAMSIGIGFGLQNIFNNFISGIILLFERPIQVGDAIEIGGIWGEIKKINVRATVVQSYDNAALIIPNSEFISKQVTNWSFKDQRLRCKVNIGVAYGSDVQQVRTTLLEIANSHEKVLKFPKPDVVFVDHGDSALLFTLRYWTSIDYMVSSSTDIRFEIDRLFEELAIEIAFPQRDIHIRSVVRDAKTVIENLDNPGGEDVE